MMVSSPSAGDPYAAAAALDRALRSNNSDGGGGGDASTSESRTLDAGPDVVVTLSQRVSAPATYDATGKMAGAATLDDLGANGPHSMAHATESTPGSADPPGASTGADNASADPSANPETAVAA